MTKTIQVLKSFRLMGASFTSLVKEFVQLTMRSRYRDEWYKIVDKFDSSRKTELTTQEDLAFLAWAERIEDQAANMDDFINDEALLSGCKK